MNVNVFFVVGCISIYVCKLLVIMSDNKTKKNTRVFFPNLNGVRFLAALVVIIHHVEGTKFWFGLPNIYTSTFVGGIFGKLGIILFFVLSGFLITYLLLEEYKRLSTISIKGFYMRRILRIWPVYYLIVLLSFFVFPNFSFFDIPGFSEYIPDHFVPKVIYYLTFLPNVGYTLYEHVSYATQVWSVGVEEQFYLIWPLVVLFALKKKKVLLTLISVIVIYLCIKTAVVVDYANHLDNEGAMKRWLFWDHFSIDCMAIGGIGAYLLFYNKEQVLNFLFNKYLQVIVYAIIAITTVKGLVVPWYNNEWYAIVFTIVILNLAANKNSIINLEFKPLNYLGKISYGLYMYHNIAHTVLLKVIMLYSIMDVSSITGGIIYHLLSIAFTVVLSALSYEYFEKWFLSLKDRFASVKSGDEVVAPKQHAVEDDSRISSTSSIAPQTA